MLFLIETPEKYKISYCTLDDFYKKTKKYISTPGKYKFIGFKYGNVDQQVSLRKKPDNYEAIKAEFNDQFDREPLLWFVSDNLGGVDLYEAEVLPDDPLYFIHFRQGVYKFMFSTYEGGKVYVSYIDLSKPEKEAFHYIIDSVGKVFFLPYDEERESYRGILLDNGYIIYEWRSRYADPCTGITTIEAPLYEKIKNHWEQGNKY